MSSNLLCPQISQLKARIGKPAAWLLEGHAWCAWSPSLPR